MKPNNRVDANESLNCIHQSGDSIILHIRVSPNASKSKIMGLYADELKIAVKAPPVDGAANKELIRFLSKLLGVPKNNLIIVRGKTSRSKQVYIEATSINEIAAKLSESDKKL